MLRRLFHAIESSGPDTEMNTVMVRLTILFAAGLALAGALPLAAASAADLSAFEGRWRAVDLQSTDAEAFKGIDAEHLGGRFEVDGDRIRIVGSALVDTGTDSIRFIPSAVDVTFIPSERPAVLAPLDAKSKLLGGLISDPEIVDPLSGETLRWGRAEDGRIVFYRFGIDEAGAYTLGQYVMEVSGDGLAFVFTAYGQARPPVSLRATLERVD